MIPEESGLGESDVESEAHVTAAFPSVPDGSKSSCCFPGRNKDPRTKNTKCVARLQEVTGQTNLLRRCLRVSLFTGLVSCQGTYLLKKLQRRRRLPLREMGTASEVEEKASERKVIHEAVVDTSVCFSLLTPSQMERNLGLKLIELRVTRSFAGNCIWRKSRKTSLWHAAADTGLEGGGGRGGFGEVVTPSPLSPLPLPPKNW